MNITADFDGVWIHFIETVYGAWLYGDPRGFRTRHHREHIEGDYKNPPPPGHYDDKLNRSVKSLQQQPVVISQHWRPIIGVALRDRMIDRGAFVLCVSLSGQHMHMLAKLPRTLNARQLMGQAKKRTNFEAKSQGWQGKLWAHRGKELPVKDRAHQLNVHRYILDHVTEGAWVWDWMTMQGKDLTHIVMQKPTDTTSLPTDAVGGLE